ncbi:hypothetical protein JXB01_00390 [Candidatus Micrarchaeota archaeon]|nr:hypothetical protein [Candidatus Micrarchaeota archaeon]
MTFKEVLKNGSYEAKVRAQGIIQKHTLKVERLDTLVGKVPFLVSEHEIPDMELVKIAEESGLPVIQKNLKVFPRGKMASDFSGL